MKTKLGFKKSLYAGLMASGASVIINSLLFFIFQAFGILTNDVYVQPNQPLTIVPVIISSILPTIIASLVYFLIEKFSENGFKFFTIISIVLLVFSFASPFMAVVNMPIGFGIVLNLMHIVVATNVLLFINFLLTKTKNL